MKRKKEKLKALGTSPSTQRYFDSIKSISFKIEEVNSDGLLKIIGTYKGMRAFRHFYFINERKVFKIKIMDLKKDIRAEFSVTINEAA